MRHLWISPQVLQKAYSRTKPSRCNTHKKQRGGAFFPFGNSHSSSILATTTVTKIPSPQLLWIQHLQTVTPVTPLDSAFTKTAGCHILQAKNFSRFAPCHLSCHPPVPLTHCPPYFLASIFASSTIAALPSGGRNEFQPALRRNPHRLRAPLLGRQYYRALRASLLLRSVCLFGPLPSRSPQLSDGARHELDRALRRPGMVLGYLRRSNRRPARLSPCSFPRLSDPCRLVLLAWFDRIFVACAGTKLFATGSSRDDSSGSASLGGRPGEALRGRYDRAGLQGECPLHRLLHLLHFGEHRWRDRTLARRINQRTPANCHRVPHGGSERLSDVFRRARVLQGTPALRRNKYREHRRDSAQFRQGPRQSQIHGIFADFFRLLDRLLAGIHLSAALCPRLHQSRHQHGPHAFDGAARCDCAHGGHECGHKENGALQRRHSWHSHFHDRLYNSGDSLQRNRRLCHPGGCRARRDNSGAPLLRIHLPPRATRTAGHLHGLRISAHRHRLARRRMVRRPRHAPIWRSRTPAPAPLVGNFRSGYPDRSTVVDLRPRRQTLRAGDALVKSADLEIEGGFYLTEHLELKTETFLS